jgi:DNA repair photolyase
MITRTFELPIHGRGAGMNPPNRFQPLVLERDADWDPTEDPAPSTQFLKDTTRSIIAYNDSPDVGFSASINPYRGCEHGCIYCYARPSHEYLDLSAGPDFETKIFVKEDAPELLREELCAKSWKPQCIAISGVTDCYQPIERRLKLTRRCLEVLFEFRNPASIITKNHLITRDIDLFKQMAEMNLIGTILSVTTLDADLARVMEPRTSSPARRLAAIESLANAGVPVGVMVAPVIPGLTDHEMPAILRACANAGATFAGFVPVRLPHAVAPLFERWLRDHRPDRAEKVLNRIRSLRGGKLNDPNFGSRMHGEGAWAAQLKDMFALAKRRAGLDQPLRELSASNFKVPPGRQMMLW